MSAPLFVANWKMFLDVVESVEQVTTHFELLERLAGRARIVLCPSFTSLGTIGTVLAQTNVALGAQDCSAHTRGAFTGQISALDLVRLGCSYAIVGHSELRSEYGYTSGVVAAKIARLWEHDLTPIVCVGAGHQQMAQEKSFAVLQEQLEPVLAVARDIMQHAKKVPLCIAYEPEWAIGTGNVPTAQHVAEVFDWLKAWCHQVCPGLDPVCLYGGSVDASTAARLVAVPGLGGLLVGRASADLQEFEKIVDCFG